ncbi:MAG: aquaporin [Euryarchaeota archaeon]|nr:aquaporin [Euryarchaeota archaeon]MDE1837999.1 aquaporin [Euryarchaeota archaeon]MDE1880647.1 aquaporin [Euryarchaeota archaeon]MDE2046454.1 aquaporin [Thermoplasmata archaeon]
MADAVPTSPTKKYLAEFLGTFTLLFGGLGAGILLGYFSPGANFPNAGFIALAVGGSIAWGVYAWGNISGGHYNPGVTLAFLLAGRMEKRDVVPYWVAQVMGGLVGLGAIFAIAMGYHVTGSSSCSTIPACTAMGADGYAQAGVMNGYAFSAASVLVLEIVASFVFYTVILFVTDKQSWKGFHGLAIGGMLGVLVLMGMNVDGAGYNPARSTASAVWGSIAGLSWPVLQLWAFWVGPFIGAAIAAFVWRVLNTEPEGSGPDIENTKLGRAAAKR